jgi:hypothetical protein
VPGGFRGLGRTRRGPMPRRRLGGGEEMRVTPARLLQQCCQAARQRRTRADRSGTSAQRRGHNGRSWMMCSLLWSKGSSPCTQLRAPVPRSRAISVPLAGVSSGTSRLLTDDCLARSARPQHATTSLCKQGVRGSSPLSSTAGQRINSNDFTGDSEGLYSSWVRLKVCLVQGPASDS